VIVFDEATSNLGQSESDKLLDVITNTTGNATVISIAHRLGVVMNCDRVIVVKPGSIEAFDHPDVLRKQTGYFSTQLSKEEVH
jgi:ABC-type multidrug transport system fused ATPase/permease subunit